MNALPDIHVLHTHDNVVVIAQECTIEVDDEFRIAVVHDLEFADNPTAHLFLGLDVDNLLESVNCGVRGDETFEGSLPFSP